jgi:hypothetical protein
MKELIYICAQPATQYFTWQVEVMINNFLKNGISPNQIQIIAAEKPGQILDSWDKLRRKYSDVGFFFYEDTRKSPVYISSLRPHILAKHFEIFPELKDKAIFYHDCDMVFTKPVDWNKFLEDDVWYLSDTNSYISAGYIKSKKYGIYERMCEIIGVPFDIPSDNEKDSGGAQYIMKNVDAEFWKKVEMDCEELYKFFQQHLMAFPQSPTYHPIQMWTADMWAVLWNAWYFNHTAKVVPEMQFTWPMHNITDWERRSIYHNAGVTAANTGMLFKAKYTQTLPYDVVLEDFNSDNCSYKYVQEILETAKNSCLLR